MDNVTHQPRPDEFARKRVLLERMQTMALELQKARRRLGYMQLQAHTTVMEGIERVVMTAHQSGLVEVVLMGVAPSLHFEQTTLVWDEAMWADKMESL